LDDTVSSDEMSWERALAAMRNQLIHAINGNTEYRYESALDPEQNSVTMARYSALLTQPGITTPVFTYVRYGTDNDPFWDCKGVWSFELGSLQASYVAPRKRQARIGCITMLLVQYDAMNPPELEASPQPPPPPTVVYYRRDIGYHSATDFWTPQYQRTFSQLFTDAAVAGATTLTIRLVRDRHPWPAAVPIATTATSTTQSRPEDERSTQPSSHPIEWPDRPMEYQYRSVPATAPRPENELPHSEWNRLPTYRPIPSTAVRPGAYGRSQGSVRQPRRGDAVAANRRQHALNGNIRQPRRSDILAMHKKKKSDNGNTTSLWMASANIKEQMTFKQLLGAADSSTAGYPQLGGDAAVNTNVPVSTQPQPSDLRPVAVRSVLYDPVQAGIAPTENAHFPTPYRQAYIVGAYHNDGGANAVVSDAFWTSVGLTNANFPSTTPTEAAELYLALGSQGYSVRRQSVQTTGFDNTMTAYFALARSGQITIDPIAWKIMAYALSCLAVENGNPVAQEPRTSQYVPSFATWAGDVPTGRVHSYLPGTSAFQGLNTGYQCPEDQIPLINLEAEECGVCWCVSVAAAQRFPGAVIIPIPKQLFNDKSISQYVLVLMLLAFAPHPISTPQIETDSIGRYNQVDSRRAYVPRIDATHMPGYPRIAFVLPQTPTSPVADNEDSILASTGVPILPGPGGGGVYQYSTSAQLHPYAMGTYWNSWCGHIPQYAFQRFLLLMTRIIPTSQEHLDYIGDLVMLAAQAPALPEAIQVAQLPEDGNEVLTPDPYVFPPLGNNYDFPCNRHGNPHGLAARTLKIANSGYDPNENPIPTPPPIYMLQSCDPLAWGQVVTGVATPPAVAGTLYSQYPSMLRTMPSVLSEAFYNNALIASRILHEQNGLSCGDLRNAYLGIMPVARDLVAYVENFRTQPSGGKLQGPVPGQFIQVIAKIFSKISNVAEHVGPYGLTALESWISDSGIPFDGLFNVQFAPGMVAHGTIAYYMQQVPNLASEPMLLWASRLPQTLAPPQGGRTPYEPIQMPINDGVEKRPLPGGLQAIPMEPSVFKTPTNAPPTHNRWSDAQRASISTLTRTRDVAFSDGLYRVDTGALYHATALTSLPWYPNLVITGTSVPYEPVYGTDPMQFGFTFTAFGMCPTMTNDMQPLVPVTADVTAAANDYLSGPKRPMWRITSSIAISGDTVAPSLVYKPNFDLGEWLPRPVAQEEPAVPIVTPALQVTDDGGAVAASSE
jgi:hypothetical protein